MTSEYGKVDILWLDGGWVRPFNTIDPTVEWQRTIKTEQDIDMDRIGIMARKNQPGIIVVDRTVPGKWENYVTPEQAVPDHTLDIPWESCITMGNSFSYVPNDDYKPAKKIVETLIKIISRGGNYLLNIAPGPNGDYDKAAYDRLNEISTWMESNQSAVFATRAIAPYHVGDYYYTKSKDNKIINVFHIQENATNYVAPKSFEFELPNSAKIKNITLLGSKEKVKYEYKNGKVKITSITLKPNYATVFQVTTQ